MNFMLVIFFMLLLHGCAEGHGRARKLRNWQDSDCKKRIDDVTTWFSTEVTRLKTKDAELVRTDEAMMKKNEETEEEFLKEVERLNKNSIGLADKDRALMNKDAHLNRKDDILMANDREQETDIDYLRQEIEELKKNDDEKDKMLEDAHKLIAELQEKAKMKVAFDAHFAYKVIPENDAIKNMVVSTNLGGLFDAENGQFTAGCNGTYRFTIDTSIPPEIKTLPVHVCLRLNDDLQADTNLELRQGNYASCTVVRRLNKGETADVFSKSMSNGDVRFSGHLIKCDHPEHMD